MGLAHRVQLADEEAAAWREHLVDYGVEPLFDQLSATAPRVAEGQMEMRDLQGHMTDTFALRGAAVKRGYKRGEVMDAGTFYDYVKGFAALGLSTVLGFLFGSCGLRSCRTRKSGKKEFFKGGARPSRRTVLMMYMRVIL